MISPHLMSLVALLGATRTLAGPLLARQAGECSLPWPATYGDTCATMASGWGISEADFISFNPGVDCNNLIPGEWYCIEWSGELPPLPTVTPPLTTSTSTRVTTTSTTTTTTSVGNGIETPSPIQAGMTPNCNRFYLVKSGDLCTNIASSHGITIAQFVSWNPASGGPSCPTLWANTYACVGIIGSTPGTTSTSTRTTTTTSPGPSVPTPINSIQTPSPTQPNMANNCYRFYFVRPGDTCATISSGIGVSVANIIQWNPAVGSNCQSMWAETYICAGVRNGAIPTYYHHGCYLDPNPNRGISLFETTRNRANNVEYCAVLCLLTHGTTIFGVQNSQDCRCGNFLHGNAVKVADSQCNSGCTGNTNQWCGALWRNNLYSTSPTPPVRFKNHGCASRASGRIFGVASQSANNMTPERCASFCFGERRTSKFALFNGRECHCGNNPSGGSQWRPDSECSMACAGNANERCGSSNRSNVYSNEDARPVFS